MLVSVLSFFEKVYMDQRLAFSGLPSSSHFHTGSISLSSFGDYFILFFLKKRNLKRRADEIETEFDSNLI